MTKRILKNDIILRALRRESVPYTPVWIMRQAGRYLPEYRKVRAQVKDFMQLCKDPELACEVTMQPLARFALDAAILFSDILTIPAAMGLGLSFKEGEGPQFARPVQSPEAIAALPKIDVHHDLNYVMQAVRLIRHELSDRLPLLGFSGSPWTLACYMVEGGSSRHFAVLKKLMYTEPHALHQLLQHLSTAIIDYLHAQIEAGVDAVMLFDTWGGVLSPRCYQAFSLDYMSQIIQGIKQRIGDEIPIILFTKQGHANLTAMATSGADALGLDWTMNLNTAREHVGDNVALQGNLDPAVLLADSTTVKEQVALCLNDFGHGNGHVFNLGHGITPDVNPDNVSVLVDTVHELSERIHATDGNNSAF